MWFISLAMSFLNLLKKLKLWNLKNKILKIEHKKIFRGPSKILKNISWPINICLKYFMVPTKTLCPPSYILNLRSLRQHGQQQFYLQYKICWILYKMVGACSFSQNYLCIQPPLKITTKNPFFYFSQLSPPYSTLNCSQNFPFNPHQQFLSLYLSNFSPPYFRVLPSQQSTPKMFYPPQPFSQFKLRQGIRELGNFVMTGTVLISPFLLKVWTVVTRLTIIDPLSLRLRKLVYWR